MNTFDFLSREPDIRAYKRGQAIFRQGDPGGDRMFAVVEGAINIELGGVTVEHIVPVGVFGEMALIDHGLRSATAVAATDSRIAVIDKKRFLRLVEQTPHFAIHMMQVMSERVRRAGER